MRISAGSLGCLHVKHFYSLESLLHRIIDGHNCPIPFYFDYPSDLLSGLGSDLSVSASSIAETLKITSKYDKKAMSKLRVILSD